MSWFRGAAGAAAFVVAAGVAGCGGGDSTSNPTTPSAVTYTDVFSGTVTQGTSSYGTDNKNHFTVRQAGNITATITKLAPLSTITVGLGLGLFDAATQTCALQYGLQVQLNVPLTASVGAAGEVCIGVVDVGNITEGTPIDYEVSVTHT